MESLDNQIVVSIRCLTYNHAPYIRQCLDGFVMQKTNFRFEAIVHDDASTDGTQDIIREYEKKYPDIIKPIYEKENQYSKHDGSLGRIMNSAMSPSSKYIAVCEGDDFWTDPYKLQKQVDYLETHPECGLVHTKHKKLVEETGEFKDGWAEETDFEKNLIRNRICTLTTCYRSYFLVDYAKEIQRSPNWPMGDAPFWLFIMSQATSKLIPDETGVYRVRRESASHSDNIEKNIRFLLGGFDMKLYFIKKYHKEEYQRINAVYVVKELKRLSYLYNKSIDFNFLSFFYKNRIWDVKLFLSTLPVKYDGLRKVMFKVKR